MGLAGRGRRHRAVGLRRVACDRRRGVQLARDAGALAVLPIVLTSQCVCAAVVGEFASASSLIAEADAVAEATETRIAPYAALMLGALRGREAEVSELIASTIKMPTAEGQGIGVQFGQWLAAILYNGLGRYDEALAAAQQATRSSPSCTSPPGPRPS